MSGPRRASRSRPERYRCSTRSWSAGSGRTAGADAGEALIRLAQRGVRVDPDLLMSYLGDPKVDDPPGRRAAARVLVELAPKVVSWIGLVRAEVNRPSPDADVAGLLLSGAAEAGQAVPPDERARLAAELARISGLGRLVGESTLVHTLARLGGDKAEDALVVYLSRTKQPAEAVWALRELSGSRAPDVRQLVERLARRADTNAEVATAAQDWLAKSDGRQVTARARSAGTPVAEGRRRWRSRPFVGATPKGDGSCSPAPTRPGATPATRSAGGSPR